MDFKGLVDKAKVAAAAAAEQTKTIMASPSSVQATPPENLEATAPAEGEQAVVVVTTTQETVVATAAPGKSFGALASETRSA